MAGRTTGIAAKTLQNMHKAFKATTDTGFNGLMSKCRLIEGEPGRIVFSLTVEPQHLNPLGSMHGGFTATLVDYVSTLALVDHREDDYMRRLGVSTNLAVTYLVGAKPGEEIHIEGRALKVGKRLAFLDCELRRAADGVVLATGTHTKYVGQ